MIDGILQTNSLFVGYAYRPHTTHTAVFGLLLSLVSAAHMKFIRLSIVLLVLALPAGLRADDQALLIELPPGALPLGVNATGTIVVGNFREGGGFYWMPTTGVISLGGDGAVESSRDGRTIVGNASDARRSDRLASGNGRRSGGCSGRLFRTPRPVTTCSARRMARAPTAR